MAAAIGQAFPVLVPDQGSPRQSTAVPKRPRLQILAAAAGIVILTTATAPTVDAATTMPFDGSGVAVIHWNSVADTGGSSTRILRPNSIESVSPGIHQPFSGTVGGLAVSGTAIHGSGGVDLHVTGKVKGTTFAIAVFLAFPP
jgi:hypothetical protein